MTLFHYSVCYEGYECDDGCVTDVTGGLVNHASLTLLLMPVEESLQFNLDVVLLLVCICCFKTISHIIIVVNPHKFFMTRPPSHSKLCVILSEYFIN